MDANAERALCAIVTVWVGQRNNVMAGKIRQRWPSLARALDSAADTLGEYHQDSESVELLPSKGFWLSGPG
jgi:hypothetical protein